MATFPPLAFTCPMKWDEMRGDERERFCATCNRTVVNLSVLTEAQRVALIAAAPRGQLCVAYYQRLSGKTNHSAASERSAKTRTLLRWGTAAAFVAALAAVASKAPPIDTANPGTQHALADTYDSMRYRVEEWIDDVRVYFGGTPRYSTMMLGMVCPSPARVVPPTAASPAPSDPPPQGELLSGGGPG